MCGCDYGTIACAARQHQVKKYPHYPIRIFGDDDTETISIGPTYVDYQVYFRIVK